MGVPILARWLFSTDCMIGIRSLPRGSARILLGGGTLTNTGSRGPRLIPTEIYRQKDTAIRGISHTPALRVEKRFLLFEGSGASQHHDWAVCRQWGTPRKPGKESTSNASFQVFFSP